MIKGDVPFLQHFGLPCIPKLPNFFYLTLFTFAFVNICSGRLQPKIHKSRCFFQKITFDHMFCFLCSDVSGVVRRGIFSEVVLVEWVVSTSYEILFGFERMFCLDMLIMLKCYFWWFVWSDWNLTILYNFSPV